MFIFHKKIKNENDIIVHGQKIVICFWCQNENEILSISAFV